VVRVGSLCGGGRQAVLTASRVSQSGVPVSTNGHGVVWFVAWRLVSVVCVIYCPCLVCGCCNKPFFYLNMKCARHALEKRIWEK
jgi:hypothetical protein